jgi:mono/diheme cytochrome c family protein
MGDDCRASGARVKHFTQAAETVRRALGGAAGPFNVTAPLPAPVPANGPSVPPNGPATGTPPVPQQAPLLRTVIVQDNNIVKETLTNFVPAQAGGTAPFWRQYATFCEQEDAERGRPDKETTELVTLARLAALTQMLAAESADIRLGLVKYLTGVAHVEATRALARMAIFSPEDDIRAAALTALKVRREKDYTDTLVKGLRYPWPAVARRAADALVKLERTDLLPELVAVLDSADPRLPEAKGADGAAVVREVVKLNHHRNCAMCHAPSGSGVPNPSAIQAEVAVQGQPLPPPGEGYQRSTPELMIRIDVTYLRADFSAALPVKDAHPWPEAQRFDFLVRERTLTADEAVAYRAALAPKEPGVPSPYHKAALAALRELTGKDAAPTAEAWRTLLELPRR